ncbi:hypothetical protein ACM66B_001737 [Microbotryomycetes sp. NB124-2]
MVASPIDYNTLTPFTMHRASAYGPSPTSATGGYWGPSAQQPQSQQQQQRQQQSSPQMGARNHHLQQAQQQSQHDLEHQPGSSQQGAQQNSLLLDTSDRSGEGHTDGNGKKKNVGGRPKDKVWEFFNGDKMLASCRFCGWRTEHPKAFRMRTHAEQCDNLPEHDKERMRSWQDEKDVKRAERLLKKASQLSPPASSSLSPNGARASSGGGGTGAKSNNAGSTNSIQIPHHVDSEPSTSLQQQQQAPSHSHDPDSSKKRRLDFNGNNNVKSSPHDTHMAAMFGHSSLMGPVSHGRGPAAVQSQMDPTLLGMAPLRSPITCHVLDSMSGKPAPGMRVQLDRFVGNTFNFYAQGMTDNDGRCGNLLPPSPTIDPGVYKMTFYTKEYFGTRNISSFYPFVEIPFEVKVADEHYHVPLLLSPYAYSTYRGS